MDKDFLIGQSNELVRGDRVFDLHNQYDFSGVAVGFDRTAQVSFDPNPEHGRGEPPVTIDFLGIDYLEFSAGFGSRPIPDLEEMGYMSPDRRDDEWLLSEQQAERTDHMFIRLGSDSIRIHSQQARLRVHE